MTEQPTGGASDLHSDLAAVAPLADQKGPTSSVDFAVGVSPPPERATPAR
jgi:hypothetical protein